MWNQRAAFFALALMVFAAGCGNSGDGSGQAPSAASGQPAASGAPAAAGGKTTPFKHVQDECTFELDAPEEMKQSAKDGMSTTYKGATFWFQGFAGTAHYGLDQLAGLFSMGGPPPSFKGTAGGVNLVIGSNPKAPPENAVMCQGEEENIKGRSVGCSFLIGGTKAREADVVAMCKSVRIKVDMSKAP